jgi:hypothetical protein
MILGEPSLDRTLRSMRRALSATLAARENRLQAIAVPQANALMAPKFAPSMQTGKAAGERGGPAGLAASAYGLILKVSENDCGPGCGRSDSTEARRAK